MKFILPITIFLCIAANVFSCDLDGQETVFYHLQSIKYFSHKIVECEDLERIKYHNWYIIRHLRKIEVALFGNLVNLTPEQERDLIEGVN